jgi:hypothetical protein
MKPFYAYSFLTGLFIGGYSNFFSKIVISTLVLYIVHPDNFTLQRFEPLYQRIVEKTHPYISKIYAIQSNSDTQINKSQNIENTEKVSIIPSPLPLQNLPILKLNIQKK